MMDYADLPIFAFLADFRWSKNVAISTFLGVARFLASSAVLVWLILGSPRISMYQCVRVAQAWHMECET